MYNLNNLSSFFIQILKYLNMQTFKFFEFIQNYRENMPETFQGTQLQARSP